MALAVATSWVAIVSPASAGAAETVTPELIQIIDTSALSSPSPDPSGLAFLSNGDLLVSDGEVEENPDLYQGKNVFELTTSGGLVDSFATTAYSDEPAGLAVSRQRIFVSDDDVDVVFIVRPGRDGTFGTKDDRVRSFGTRRFGCRDPEGLAVGGGFLFIASGHQAEVFRLRPGPNGYFDGVAPKGDDRVRHFDTSGLGEPDTEGIEYRPETGTLFIVSNRRESPVIETTIRGRLLTTIDMSGLGMHSPAGLAWGPGSDDPTVDHLYIADRGVDNVADPNENDGRIFEISF